MEKACLHCKQRLSFLRAVRGELFCSSDHRELYLQAEAALAFERVAFFDNPSPPDREAVEAPEVQPAHVGTKKPILEDLPARVTTPPVAEVKPEPARVIEMAEPTPAPLHDASPSVPEATAPVVPEPGELVSMTTPNTTANTTAKPRRPIPIWLAPGIAAGLAIVVLGALFFGPSRKSAHSSLPHVMQPLSAADQDVNIARADSAPRQIAVIDSKVQSPGPKPAPPAAPVASGLFQRLGLFQRPRLPQRPQLSPRSRPPRRQCRPRPLRLQSSQAPRRYRWLLPPQVLPL